MNGSQSRPTMYIQCRSQEWSLTETPDLLNAQARNTEFCLPMWERRILTPEVGHVRDLDFPRFDTKHFRSPIFRDLISD